MTVARQEMKALFVKMVNTLIADVKAAKSAEQASEASDLLLDFAKETGSLFFCYELISEEDFDKTVARAEEIRKLVVSKAKSKGPMQWTGT